ncbi:MAG: hypothetical protein CMB56_001485 [Methanobacteriota archaeon]|nr:MAG: hypothetical protein CMB56_001485 [Euryarchaeota archaeon]|tara:strand:+ start:15601 stop:16560 length:960 start_codon:yes stop_codon:yes gene_type:complete
MKIAIVGIGSIGGLIAGQIANLNKHDLLLCTKNDIQKLELITNGLTIVSPANSNITIDYDIFSVCSGIDDLDDKWINSCDLVLICTKSHSTHEASYFAKKIISKNGYCISIQNGIGNEEVISSVIGFNSVLGGVITHGANKVDSSVINWAGMGEIIIGKMPLTKINLDLIEHFISIFNEANLNASSVHDIRVNLWSKLSINAAINPIAAICGVNNGALIEPYLFECSISAMQEVLQVARAIGVDVPSNHEMINSLTQIIKNTKENRCSMLQDIMNGRRTEIDSICGEVIKNAENLGIQTPVNYTLMSIVKGISSSNFIP